MITFFISGKSRRFKSNHSDCIGLYICVFDNFIFAHELFGKPFCKLKTYPSYNNNNMPKTSFILRIANYIL